MELNTMNAMKIGLSILTAMGVLACQPNEKEKTEQKVRVSATDRMSSDDLTSSAEQLIGPYTFMLAHQMAVRALEKDPTNVKAEFIKTLTQRFEAFRGIHFRMRTLLNPDQLAKHDRWLREFPASPLKTFLLDPRGGVPLKTTTDVQDVVSNYYKGVQAFRQFLIDKQDSRIDLQMNPHVFEQEIRQDLVDNCQVLPGNGNDYEVVCDVEGIATKKMNSADLIMLRQMAAGELIYGAFLNSYSLEGIEKLESLPPMSNAKRVEWMSQLPHFGKLRQDNLLVLMRSIGSDLSAALKWASKYQKQLCPPGVDPENARRGYLFKDGICVVQDGSSQDVNNTIAFIDRALGGAITMTLEDNRGNKVNTQVDLFAWSRNPVRDLRSIKPVAWNQCDKATKLQDGTLGGIFVEGNALSFFDTECD